MVPIINHRTSQTKTSAHTLVRVRNNQRRHRERRREYIASLEQKLRESEALLTQARAEVVVLQTELERLRKMNNDHSQGLTSPMVAATMPCHTNRLSIAREEVTEAARQQGSRLEGDSREIWLNPSVSGSISEIALATSATAISLDSHMPLPALIQFADNDLLRHGTFSPWRPLSPIPTTVSSECHLDCTTCNSPRRCRSPTNAPSQKNAMNKEVHSSHAVQSPNLVISPPTHPTHRPSNEACTTPCSQAYILIEEQNHKGLNQDTIRSWLYQGFKQARHQNEGCRVDNKILFGLLDFISGI